MSLFHYILISLVLLIIYHDLAGCKKKYLRNYNIFYIILFSLAAFRYGMGIDTPGYMNAFNYIPKIQDLQRTDFLLYRFNPLYLVTNSLCKSISDNFLLFQLLQTSLYFGSTYLLLKEIKLRKFYLLLIFYLVPYFTDGYSAMRESFGIAFCQFACFYLLKGNLIKSLLLIFVGCFYHTGCIIAFIIPLFFLFFRDSKNKTILFFIAGSLLVILFVNQIISMNFFDIGNDNSVNRYLNASDVKNSTNILNIIKNVILISICIYVLKKKENINCWLYYLGITYCVFDVLSVVGISIAYRMNAFFVVFFMYTIYNIISYVKRWKNVILSIIFLCLFYYQSFARYIDLFNSSRGYEALEDYCSVFSNEHSKRHYKNLIIHANTSDYILY